MSLFAAIAILAVLSAIAFWRPIAPLFMIMAGISLMLGLYCFDVFTTGMGMAISLVLIGYSLVCMGYAYKVVFSLGKEEG